MNDVKNVLVIEDDETIAFGIKTFLERNGIQVILADCVCEAKHKLVSNAISIILLDWNLPDGSGEELCRWIRAGCEAPVIFLTVRDSEKDIVHGFDLGADDFITKPFQLSVLLSRINAVLRRVKGSSNQLLSCGSILLDREKTKVTCDGEELFLTAGEYRLLLFLMENKNQILTRTQLLEKSWDSNGNFVNDNTLTVTMKRLREKLNNPSCIKTFRGIGYRMEDYK